MLEPVNNPSLHIVLVGCGKMGQAMLQGWLKGNIVKKCDIIDPHMDSGFFPKDFISVHHDTSALPAAADIIVFAVKPQVMADVLPDYAPLMQSGAVGLSIAAGTPLSLFEACFGSSARLVRTMPNTPAAIGMGMTALYANANVSDPQKSIVQAMMEKLGETVWIPTEDMMHEITALSGSGPAYVFHMIEAMAEAGRAAGLPDETSMILARQTVAGAAALAAEDKNSSAETLRRNVTSPGGTTEAGLKVLMNPDSGLSKLMTETIRAAAERSRQLGEK